VKVTEEELARLAPEWERLWRRCPDATAFQTPGWALAFARAFDAEGTFAICARDRGELVGIAPMYFLGRTLLPVGAGVTDRLDPLLAPANATGAFDAARALWSAIEARRGEWERCDYAALAPGSPFAATAPAGASAWEDEPCVEVPLRDGGWRAACAPWLRRNLDKARRRAARARLEIVDAPPDAVTDVLGELERLHGARWGARGQPGIFHDPRVRQMHADAAPRLVERGLAHLYALRREGGDGHAVAVLYVLSRPGAVECYASGFDPAEKALSPVALLVAHAAGTPGTATLDFLRGREAYKYDWGGRDVAREGLTIR
jgi:CelD/BcsL family acetyltransferase involved in cellulose biosynthesis